MHGTSLAQRQRKYKKTILVNYFTSGISAGGRDAISVRQSTVAVLFVEETIVKNKKTNVLLHILL